VSGRLQVRVHPGAKRSRIVGWLADGSLKLSVTAVPEAGRANEAVLALLAEALGVGRGDVKVLRGQSSRAKAVEVEGLDDGAIRRRLEAHLEGTGTADAD
jgi:uncharacterized protein YggU (UPF0235/DUF167 family)